MRFSPRPNRMRSCVTALAAAAALTLFSALLQAPAHAVATCDGLPATIEGTNGNDTISGTDGPDVIAGLGGDDTIAGLGGDDRICGNGGSDTVYGERENAVGDVVGGNDRIFGDGGNDLLIGDFGNVDVTAFGAPGGDHVEGGEGADVLVGDVREVTIAVGAGHLFSDVLLGGPGADVIYGDAEVVTLNGAGVGFEGGNDTIDGGEGADILVGDIDTLQGLVGTTTSTGFRDAINGGGGADDIYGDARIGNDKLVPLQAGMSDNIDGGDDSQDSADAGPGTDTCTNVENETNCEAGDDPAMSGITCGGEATLTYSPGLTNEPRVATVTTSYNYDPCATSPGPGPTSGTDGVTVMRETSCTAAGHVLNDFEVTGTVEWNTGDSSTYSGTARAQTIGGTVYVVTEGTITGGLFAGNTFARTITLLNPDPVACSTPEGVEEINGAIVLEILPS